MANTNNPYKTYLKQEIEGATKGKLVLLLYDGTIKFLRVAKKGIEQKNVEEAHNHIIKAENIIYELMSTLNMDAGEISVNLMRLYDFMLHQLVTANSSKTTEPIDTVIKMMSTLREAWREIVEKEEKEQTKEQGEAKSINFAG